MRFYKVWLFPTVRLIIIWFSFKPTGHKTKQAIKQPQHQEMYNDTMIECTTDRQSGETAIILVATSWATLIQ
jgi:hypothetical protein